MANVKSKATHITKSSGNVFADLGLADSILLQMKTDLHSEIVRVVKSKKITPRELEKMFDVPQPRISELLRGKLAGLSINKLTEYAATLGIRPKLAFDRARAA
jgi:predicted XRE-type DNA-binding protein